MITAVALLAGTLWWVVEYVKESKYDWIEICTLEGVKKVKYDDEGNLLAEEWISRIPAHVLEEMEVPNKAALAKDHEQEAVSSNKGQYTELDGVQIEQCWVRLLPGHLPAAGYFELTNNSGLEHALIGVESTGYGSAILHENVNRQGMATMEALSEVRVPVKGRLSFSPQTNHIMLENRSSSLKAGDFIGMTFYFQGNGIKTVQCKINGPNALSY